MLDTWGQLLTLAGLLTIFALWRFNILLSIISSCAWLAFTFYHANNPPTNITQGDTADTYIIWASIAMILAIPLITIIRGRSRTSSSIGGIEGDERRSLPSNANQSYLQMSPEEYATELRRRRQVRRR